MGIEGNKRTQTENFQRKVGLFTARVLTINPDVEEYKELLGIELKEDSKATEYLGTSSDGNKFLRIDVWLEEVNKNKATEELFRHKVTFFLEDKERENKDFTKKQYINTVGTCSWAEDPNELYDWFKEREYRVAYVGEEDLYTFLRTWLGNLDYRSAETTLQIEWKKLMRGNVKDLRDQVDGEWCTNFGALATIIVKEKEGEIKEYQGIYNRSFLPEYCLKHFRLIDFSDEKVIAGLRLKKTKSLKPHEKFVLNIISEHGCKDHYILRDLRDYVADDNIVASDKVIDEENADY